MNPFQYAAKSIRGFYAALTAAREKVRTDRSRGASHAVLAHINARPDLWHNADGLSASLKMKRSTANGALAYLAGRKLIRRVRRGVYQANPVTVEVISPTTAVEEKQIKSDVSTIF